MNAWDIALIAAVSAMSTAVAYLRKPQHKAFVLMLPVPFTLAALAVGRPVDSTNVLATGAMFGFMIGVWWLYNILRCPIVPAIAACAAGYCAIGTGLARLNLAGDAAFWSSVVLMAVLFAALTRLLPYRREPEHRTPLPVWIKLPAIALVVFGLVLIKRSLVGFTTMFPMVGVVAVYEARRSLWTLVRRIPWVGLLIMPMMAVIRLAQSQVGLLAALGLGWPVYLLLLWLFRRHYTEAE